MKLVEVKNNFVLDTFCDLLSQEELQDPTRQFTEAPDCVHGGWGYYKGHFLKPQPPEGWTYIEKVNCFAPIDMEERKKLGMRTDL